jgi:taurine dioxygenase
VNQLVRNLKLADLEILPLTPTIGAEIRGIDLARPLDAGAVGHLRTALLDWKVLFFRDQTITTEQHLAFARNFGDLEVHPFAPHKPGYPEVLALTHDKDNKGRENTWHSDVTWREIPSMGSILRAVEVPPVGGDTLFANMYAAYESLSDRMKAYLEGLTALHDGEPIYRGLYANYGVADRPSYPSAEHPVVRTHPVTGRKALYVNRGFTRHINGIPRDESDAMLAYLYQHAENPLFQCRFRWTENAIAFWDNRCTQHRAMWDYWPHTRSGTRVTVKGERPV